MAACHKNVPDACMCLTCCLDGRLHGFPWGMRMEACHRHLTQPGLSIWTALLYCTMHTPQIAHRLHTMHSAQCTVHTGHTEHCAAIHSGNYPPAPGTLCTVHTAHSTHRAVHRVLNTLCTAQITHPKWALCTAQCAHFTLHTAHFRHYTLYVAETPQMAGVM